MAEQQPKEPTPRSSIPLVSGIGTLLSKIATVGHDLASAMSLTGISSAGASSPSRTPRRKNVPLKSFSPRARKSSIGSDADSAGESGESKSTSPSPLVSPLVPASAVPCPPPSLPLSVINKPTVPYVVKNGENFSGVAFKFRMTVDELKAVNKISDPRPMVTPGQIIRVVANMRKTSDASSSTRRRASKEEPKQEDPSSEGTKIIRGVVKEPAFYCTKDGNVRGMLFVTPYLVIFEPSTDDNRVRNAGVMKYQVCIDITDVIECGAIGLPSEKYSDDIDKLHEQYKDYYLQINLRRTDGNKKAELSNAALVFFKVGSLEQVQPLCERLLHWIEYYKSGRAESIQNTSSTFVPFADPLHSSQAAEHIPLPWVAPVSDNTALLLSAQGPSTAATIVTTPDAILSQASLTDLRLPMTPFKPLLLSPSQILDEDQITQIAAALPPLCRLKNWHLLYSPAKHGTSINTFYRKTAKQGPTIVVIKDTLGYVFGGFASEAWHISPHFYGTGESFLYSFRRNEAMQCFKWSEQNEFFIYSDEESITMGAGGQFGLFVDSEFEKGTSGECETYNSESLSSTEDFIISKIEFWGFTNSEDFEVEAEEYYREYRPTYL
eukprot:GILK01003846.1.p1 GENE.GILK01003846.1~~GILK01003846.1.p1  ORF type:complete len:607 (+),score=90.01 GILK01003846.1:153-1973(+)